MSQALADPVPQQGPKGLLPELLRNPRHAEDVAEEQMRMVLAHTRFGTFAATLFALFMGLYLHGSVGPRLVGAWITIKVLVAAIRIVVAHVYTTRRHPGGPRWRLLTYSLLALDGAVWGVAGFWMVFEPVKLAALLVASVACVTCVATFGLQARLLATAAYVVPILVPTTVGMLLRGDEFGLVGGGSLPLLLALQLLTAAGTQRRFMAGVTARLQAQELAEQKAAALQLAQRESEVKTQFLANISHELRTPLHGILGLARLLHLDARERAVAHRLELIESSATHLLGLINDLLDVSRIETGRFAFRQERFDVVTQAGVVAGVYLVRARDKGIKFSLVNDLERPTWVLGDAARFRQVLHNLLGNAIKFTQQGGIEMKLARGATAEEIRVEVSDTGHGIATDALQNIFQPFFQVDHGTDVLTSGAGLGLTIAHELARAMRGDIIVTSVPGVGSTFVFTACLPAAAAPDEAGEDADPAARAPLAVRNVLVAEDDDVNALIISAYLEQLGLVCERVSNGQEAVSRALREIERPDLILMDCRMPVMDGMAATRAIRAQERTLALGRVPVIALTAASAPEDRQQCTAAGMDDFIAKPFTKAELIRVLAQWGGAVEDGKLDVAIVSRHA